MKPECRLKVYEIKSFDVATSAIGKYKRNSGSGINKLTLVLT